MSRAPVVVAATLFGVIGLVAAGSSAAQSSSGQGASGQASTPAQAPPPMTSILAGKKFTPPIRGQADVEFVKGATKREGSTLVTKIQVKNISTGPIPRLKITETWYDKKGGTIPGGEGVINGLLQPNEIQTVEIRTPVDPNMSSSMLLFSHANGAVKTHPVKSFDAPKEPAAKTASSKKK
ncbi:MAG TPA: hypothetical protein VNZ26_10965 [Vicinamibacterales bacterium]|jgi:hypothetical protein|nr:hypothetical protein [Vicinamibacterales bacterium]